MLACMHLATAFQRALPDRDWPRLARHGVLVASTDLAPWRPWLGDAWNLLDAGQRERAQRQRRPADQESLALAYALHRMLLGEALGLDPSDVPLYRDSAGCPRIKGSRVHTSLSHAAGKVAIAVSGSGPVGVDLEPDCRAREMPGIADRICAPGELELLARLPAPERPAWLLALWVRKEAYLKAEGIGLAREMPDFQAPEELPIASETLPGTSFRVSLLNGDPGMVMAVAAAVDSSVNSATLRPSPG